MILLFLNLQLFKATGNSVEDLLKEPLYSAEAVEYIEITVQWEADDAAHRGIVSMHWQCVLLQTPGNIISFAFI